MLNPRRRYAAVLALELLLFSGGWASGLIHATAPEVGPPG